VHRLLGEQQEDRNPDIPTTPGAATVVFPVMAPGASPGTSAERAGAATPAVWAARRTGCLPEVVVIVPVLRVVREAVRGVTVLVHVRSFRSR